MNERNSFNRVLDDLLPRANIARQVFESNLNADPAVPAPLRARLNDLGLRAPPRREQKVSSGWEEVGVNEEMEAHGCAGGEPPRRAKLSLVEGKDRPRRPPSRSSTAHFRFPSSAPFSEGNACQRQDLRGRDVPEKRFSTTSSSASARWKNLLRSAEHRREFMVVSSTRNLRRAQRGASRKIPQTFPLRKALASRSSSASSAAARAAHRPQPAAGRCTTAGWLPA